MYSESSESVNLYGIPGVRLGSPGDSRAGSELIRKFESVAGFDAIGAAGTLNSFVGAGVFEFAAADCAPDAPACGFPTPGSAAGTPVGALNAENSDPVLPEDDSAPPRNAEF